MNKSQRDFKLGLINTNAVISHKGYSWHIRMQLSSNTTLKLSVNLVDHVAEKINIQINLSYKNCTDG